jgi:hypothetical protein
MMAIGPVSGTIPTIIGRITIPKEKIFKNTNFAIRNLLKIALSVVIWIIEKAL